MKKKKTKKTKNLFTHVELLSLVLVFFFSFLYKRIVAASLSLLEAGHDARRRDGAWKYNLLLRRTRGCLWLRSSAASTPIWG